MLNLYDWLDQAEYLTIKDIEKMKYGECKKLLCINKNFYDLLPNKIKTPISIEELFGFSDVVCTYTHSDNLKGHLQWYFPSIEMKNFEFHIECIPNFFFRLSDGYLPDFNVPGVFDFKDFKTYWKDYPKETRLGWREPMIDWEKVKKYPKINRF